MLTVRGERVNMRIRFALDINREPKPVEYPRESDVYSVTERATEQDYEPAEEDRMGFVPNKE